MRRKTLWQIATKTYAYKVDRRVAKRREKRSALSKEGEDELS